MATFRGLLEVEGDPDSSLVADIDISEGRISLRAGGNQIADWPLSEIDIEERDGSFRVEADEGTVLLYLSDGKRFARTVGVPISIETEALLPPSDEAQDEPPPAPDQSLDEAPDGRPPAPVGTRDETPDERPPVPVEPLDTAPERAIVSEPVSDAVADDRGEPAGRLEGPLARRLSLSFMAAAVVLLVGAILDWGPVRITSGTFPVEKILVVVAAAGTAAAAYLGLARENRRDVALVGLISGIAAAIVIVWFARRARIGWGFIVTLLGTLGVFTISVMALSRLGATADSADDDAA